MARGKGRSGRRYVRDNRGRFASKGAGATARGGRLRTASGKKRATQTMKVAGSGSKIRKPISGGSNKPSQQISSKRQSAAKPAGSLTPKSKIRARMAAQAKASQTANSGNYQRRFQSDRTKAAAAQYRASGSKGQKYSTIKNPAPEGSAPFAVTGSTYQGRKNAAAGRAARDAKPKRSARAKTDLQAMQQADRIMSKLAKRQKSVVNNASNLESGLRGIRRNNARAGVVNRSLQSRGLLGKYSRLTAPADPTRMTPAGKGIPKPKKPASTAAKAKKAAKPAAAAAKPAATTRLKRSGAKTRVWAMETNLERGRRGVVSMSPAAKAARRGNVAERRSERLQRITERQSGIVARRQINRASNYNPDGTFNQSAANANQRRLKRSQQLQERLRLAATGPAIASGALTRKKPARRRGGRR